MACPELEDCQGQKVSYVLGLENIPRMLEKNGENLING